MSKFFLTNHAVDRFKERFGNMIHDGANPHSALLSIFYGAKPDRSFLNNTEMMVFLGEKYGYSKPIDVRVNGDIVFICRGRKVLTLYNRHESVYSNSRRSRFSCRAVQ